MDRAHGKNSLMTNVPFHDMESTDSFVREHASQKKQE